LIEGFIAGAAAATIGVLGSHGISTYARQRGLAKRVGVLEQTVPELISRAEVQNAFAEMAQIEGQRVAQQQQQMQMEQQARAQAVFGSSQSVQTANALNAQVNDQLSALNERINALKSNQ